MSLFILGAAGVLGAVIGSFCNVVILRLHTGEGFGGRSQCPVCGHSLSWYELIPVVSYAWQRGRCRACHARISPQYPIVEAATAVSFVFAAASLPTYSFSVQFGLFLTEAVFAATLICIFMYDMRHTIIPDVLVAVAALAGLAHNAIGGGGLVVPAASVLAAGLIWAAPIAVLWYVSNGMWIGLGDAKLAWAVGWFFGLATGGSILLLAVWIGAAISVVLLLYARISHVHRLWLAGSRLPRTMQSEVPFGPFIILSAAIHAWFSFSASDVIAVIALSV